MSIESTLSFHMGTRFNEKHNNRTIPCPMADSDYETQHNWYHPKNMSLEQAYEILFAESSQLLRVLFPLLDTMLL